MWGNNQLVAADGSPKTNLTNLSKVDNETTCEDLFIIGERGFEQSGRSCDRRGFRKASGDWFVGNPVGATDVWSRPATVCYLDVHFSRFAYAEQSAPWLKALTVARVRGTSLQGYDAQDATYE